MQVIPYNWTKKIVPIAIIHSPFDFVSEQSPKKTEVDKKEKRKKDANYNI